MFPPFNKVQLFLIFKNINISIGIDDSGYGFTWCCPPLLQMYFSVFSQNCCILVQCFLDADNSKKTWRPVWQQTARACCCLPAGATLPSCIPVGIRIILGAFLSEHTRLLYLRNGFHIKLKFLRNLATCSAALIKTYMRHSIFCWFHPNTERLDSTSAPQYRSVTPKEEEQRSLHQTPEPEQWELGVDSPRRSHLPRREWSPFVSYCGMRRQIDEGRVIPSGPGEAAGRAESPNRHHRELPLLLSPHSAVTWRYSLTPQLGKMKRGRVFEKLM